LKRTAILITSFNRKELTVKCIESIKDNLSVNSIKFDIYVADSNSKDNTIKAINEMKIGVNIFNVGDNIFWNQGIIMSWKKAVKKANYDFYVLLNDDTFLYKNAFNILFENYNKCINKSIIVGTTIQDDFITYGGRINSMDENVLIPNGNPQEIKFMNGNIVLIPKIIFEKLGFLNPRFSHSLGDIDYGLRALKQNFKLYSASEIIGYCANNDFKWYNPKNSLLDRYRLMISPKGVPFGEYIYFNYTHFGFLSSLKFIFASLFALIFPKLYINYKK